MFNSGKVWSRVFLILVSGVLILGMGFVFMSCGKDPQWKVADSDKGQFALDFSKAPGVFGVAYVSNPTNIPSIEDTELTVEAWVKNKSDNLTGAIFGRMDSLGVVLFVKNNEPKFSIRRDPITYPEITCNSLSPTSTECTVESGSSLVKDVWTHITGVLTTEDHSTGPNNCINVGSEKPHLAIYINGVLENCATTESRFANDPANKKNYLMTIGLMGDGDLLTLDKEITTATRFDGVIDEVRLWTVARSQTQIQACMNQELSFYTPGDCYVDPSILKGYWRLNEGKGSQVFDISGTGTSGVIESPPPPFTRWTTGWVEGAPITKD